MALSSRTLVNARIEKLCAESGQFAFRLGDYKGKMAGKPKTLAPQDVQELAAKQTEPVSLTLKLGVEIDEQGELEARSQSYKAPPSIFRTLVKEVLSGKIPSEFAREEVPTASEAASEAAGETKTKRK